MTSANKAAISAARAARNYSTPVESSGVSFGLSEDQEAYRDLARKFAREEIIPAARHHDQTMEYPTEIIKKAWEVGLLNTHIPEEYGGPSLGLVECALISEELAYGCSVFRPLWRPMVSLRLPFSFLPRTRSSKSTSAV